MVCLRFRCASVRVSNVLARQRLDASLTKVAKGSIDKPPTRCVAGNARSACAAPLDSSDDAMIATVHSIGPRDRKPAFVLAAVQGDAVTRRPDCRRGPPLRATAVRTFGRDEGMIRVLTEQRSDRRFAIGQSRNFDLNGEARTARTKQSSPIIPPT